MTKYPITHDDYKLTAPRKKKLSKSLKNIFKSIDYRKDMTSEEMEKHLSKIKILEEAGILKKEVINFPIFLKKIKSKEAKK
jgi:hypothetical protein